MKKALAALVLLLACLSVDAAQKPKTKDAALEAHLHNVEHGLLPNTLIKGTPPAAMELTERMRFYKVPGVSVAVIEDGRVDWARGYGCRRRARAIRSRPRRCSKPPSISKPVARSPLSASCRRGGSNSTRM